MLNALSRVRFPARLGSLRILARILVALALAGFALQPVAMATAGGPPLSLYAVAGSAFAGAPAPADGHNHADHGTDASRTPAPVPAHAHSVACLTLCCFATLPDLTPAAVAYDLTPLSRFPATETRPTSHLPALDPPPPRLS